MWIKLKTGWQTEIIRRMQDRILPYFVISDLLIMILAAIEAKYFTDIYSLSKKNRATVV